MITATVTLLTGSYEAALDDEPEWPPHPGRLFSAFVSAAEPGSADDTALRWLQRQLAPAVVASVGASSSMRAYVPTNAGGKDTHQTYLGRTSAERTWQRTHPRCDTVHVVWEQAEAPQEILQSLRRVARRIPYLGRATSPVLVQVSATAPAVDDTLLRVESPGDRSVSLRVPHVSSLEALRGAFEAGERARSVDRWLPYGPPERARSDDPVRESPWPEMLTFGLPTGVALDGRLVVRIAAAFRSALLAGLQAEYGPQSSELALLHGHHDGTLRQSAFLALPTVGGKHADGQVRGLAVALSPDLPPRVRRSVLHLLGMDIDVPRLAPFHVPGLLSPSPLSHGFADGRQTVSEGRWTRPSRVWSSVTPIVLDRFPRRPDDVLEHVWRAVELAGLPTPTEGDVLRTSVWHGAAHLRRSDLQRRRDDPARLSVHCRATFADPQAGPVLVGNMRHLGLGLFLPGPVDAS